MFSEKHLYDLISNVRSHPLKFELFVPTEEENRAFVHHAVDEVLRHDKDLANDPERFEKERARLIRKGMKMAYKRLIKLEWQFSSPLQRRLIRSMLLEELLLPLRLGLTKLYSRLKKYQREK